VALDLIRSRHPVVSLDRLSARGGEPGSRQEAAEQYRRVLLREDIERALSRLPARYREPIRLHLLEGLPQEDVGQLLGRPRSTIATQIERGLARLRRLLSGLIMVSG
jgi:RNA polymerase sigma factor (sigma-70 family)